jgi:hypothetical protein
VSHFLTYCICVPHVSLIFSTKQRQIKSDEEREEERKEKQNRVIAGPILDETIFLLIGGQHMSLFLVQSRDI